MMSRGVEERDVRLAVGKLDGLHQITPDGVTEREVKAEEGGAGVVGGERRRKW